MSQAEQDFLSNGPTTTDRAPTWITGTAAYVDNKERRRPGAILSYRATSGQSQGEKITGLIRAALFFSRGT